MKLSEAKLQGYLLADLPNGNQIMVWRIGMFPAGVLITHRVFRPRGDGSWTTTSDGDDFVGAETVERFLKKNPTLADLDWREPEGAVDI